MTSENIKKEILLHIHSEQRVDGSFDESDCDFDAVLYEKGGAVYIMYDDGEPCSIKSSGKRVLISRHKSGSRLEIEQGASHYSTYYTPYGPCEACVTAIKVEDKLMRFGRMELCYKLELGGAVTNNQICITVKEKV